MTKDFNPETAMGVLDEFEGSARGTTLDLTPEEVAENRKRLCELYSRVVSGGVSVIKKEKPND